MLPTDDLPVSSRTELESVDTANMTMTTTTFLQRAFGSPSWACAAALTLDAVCASPSHAQTVAVMVNGEPITNYDIEQRTKLIFLIDPQASGPAAGDRRTDR